MLLADITARMKESATPKSALDHLFGTARKEITGDGDWTNAFGSQGHLSLDARTKPVSKDDLLAFLTEFRARLAGEDKANAAKKVNRLKAIDLAILTAMSFDDPAITTPAGPIDLYAYLFDLALRIREPKLIQQGGTSWCAIDTVVRSYAKNDPFGYARLAVDLVVSKSGTLHGTRVPCITSGITGTDALKNAGMVPVDYITIGSVLTRFNQEAGTWERGGWNWNDGLTDAQIMTLLGLYFTDVHLDAAPPHSADEWQYTPAKERWLKGHDAGADLKMLLINGNIVNALRQETFNRTFDQDDGKRIEIDRRKGPDYHQTVIPTKVKSSGQHGRHAVLLDRLAVDGNGRKATVTLKIYTWGSAVRSGTLTLEQLCLVCRGIATAKAKKL